MSRNEIDRLVAELQKKPELMADFRRLAADPDRLVQWALEKDYRVVREDLKHLAESDRELSDDELEDAAGGDDAWAPGGTPPPGGGTGGTGGTGSGTP